MLVEDGAGQVGRAPVDRLAGERHGAGQRDPLLERHAAEEHRHGEGGGLALGDGAAGQAGDELADLGFAQRPPVALGADDFLRQAHAAFAFVGAR